MMTGPRTYDATTGRFWQGDPLARVEAYVYSSASPIRRLDSNGYQDRDSATAAVAASNTDIQYEECWSPVFTPELAAVWDLTTAGDTPLGIRLVSASLTLSIAPVALAESTVLAVHSDAALSGQYAARSYEGTGMPAANDASQSVLYATSAAVTMGLVADAFTEIAPTAAGQRTQAAFAAAEARGAGSVAKPPGSAVRGVEFLDDGQRMVDQPLQSTAGSASSRAGLLDELGASGVKVTPENVVQIERINGQIVFLESGNNRGALSMSSQCMLMSLQREGYQRNNCLKCCLSLSERESRLDFKVLAPFMNSPLTERPSVSPLP